MAKLTSLLWSSLFLLLLFLGPKLTSADDEQEAEALLTLKSLFENADGLSSWTNGTFPCDKKKPWDGIICYRGFVTGIHLRNIKLSGTVHVESLSRLPWLRSVSFVNTASSGEIPDFSKLEALKSLYLFNNQFNGSIPDNYFTKLTHLKKLWLSRNFFSGFIPSSLSMLPLLIELRLDNNKFTGSLLDIDLPALKVFNVSNNQLEGPVPTKFQRFKESAFLGNPNLCGPPLVNRPCLVSNKPAVQVENTSGSVKSGKTAMILMILITVALSLIALVALIKRKRMDNDFDVGSTYGQKDNPSQKWQQQQQKGSYHSTSRSLEQSKKGNVRSGSSADLVIVNREHGTFTMPDLMKAAAEVLGSGGLGSAYKAVTGNGFAVVVKRMKEMNRLSREEFDVELRRMGGLKHPNVLAPIGYHFRKEEKLLLFPYVDRGSLLYLLHGDRGPHHAALDWPTRLRIIIGIAKGMTYLHDELSNTEVPHGNLKSGNILLLPSYEPMLIDYGYTSLVSQELAAQVMFAYRSPESIRNGYVTPKSDVYCFGIVILEILTGKFPSQYLSSGKGGTDLVQWVNTASAEGKEAELIDSEIVSGHEQIDGMVQLLRIGVSLTEPIPDQRPSMREVVKRIEDAVGESLLVRRDGSGLVSRIDSVGEVPDSF